MKLYMMVGVPGSGKTTYALTRIENAVYLGTDAIRKELYGCESAFWGHRKVHSILHQRLLNALSQGHDVVIDCTNITRKRRKKVLSLLPDDCEAIAVYIQTPLIQTLKQNRMRKRHVPWLGIVLMRLRLSVPEEKEGFAKIVKYK